MLLVRKSDAKGRIGRRPVEDIPTASQIEDIAEPSKMDGDMLIDWSKILN